MYLASLNRHRVPGVHGWYDAVRRRAGGPAGQGYTLRLFSV